MRLCAAVTYWDLIIRRSCHLGRRETSERWMGRWRAARMPCLDERRADGLRGWWCSVIVKRYGGSKGLQGSRSANAAMEGERTDKHFRTASILLLRRSPCQPTRTNSPPWNVESHSPGVSGGSAEGSAQAISISGISHGTKLTSVTSLLPLAPLILHLRTNKLPTRSARS